jgi:hypothetical protein
VRTRRGLAASVAVALLCALGARAEADTRGAEEARKAFRALVQVEAQQPPIGQGTLEAEQESIRVHREWRRRLESALERFRAAFAAADWATWPASPGDAVLLERGLLGVGEAALEDLDGRSAVAAYERAAALPGLSEDAVERVERGRTAAHLAAGAPEPARALAAAATTKAPKERRPGALVRQGDLEWPLGRLDAARRFYAEASAAAPPEGEFVYGLDAVAATEARWKLRLVGRPLGALAPEWVVGFDAGEFRSYVAGRVLVLVFPDPYDPPRLDVASYARFGESGAVVVCVLSPSMTHQMPGSFMDVPTGSFPRVRGEPQPQSLAQWAERFRRVAHVGFPFVGLPPERLPVGKAVLGSAVVVQGDGTIAYYRAPHEPVTYLAAVLARLLPPR